MARVAGRSPWIAWPVGVICAGVVVALLWLAAPGVPGAIEFTGNLLRGAAATTSEAADAAAEDDGITDCRGLYPDRLWSELVWTPEVLLSQTLAPPATATSLATALAPSVVLTCEWRAGDGRTISTTLSAVAGDAVAVAQAALPAEGFACTEMAGGVRCERAQGGVTEIHDLRGERWVASTLTGWQSHEYAAQVASRVFPEVSSASG